MSSIASLRAGSARFRRARAPTLIGGVGILGLAALLGGLQERNRGHARGGAAGEGRHRRDRAGGADP